VDPRDPATSASAGRFATDYTGFLDKDGLRGARLGIAREAYFGYSEKTDAIAEAAIAAMEAAGAVIVDPADIPTAKQMSESHAELEVLHYEFKADLNAYLAGLNPEAAAHSLEDVIAFNEAHREQEMPYFGQEHMLAAQAKGPLTEPAYLTALEENHRLARQEGIDAVMERLQLDALVMPTGSPPWKIDLVDGDHGLGGSSQPAAPGQAVPPE